MTQYSSHKPIEVFISYSHKDKRMRDELVDHLMSLIREGVITAWLDRKIGAGNEWAGEIDQYLNAASVILLLISSHFMASDYCNDVEVKHAMKRHEAGDAKVIPVILRPVEWGRAPFSKLKALPKDGKPVSLWPHRDEAYLDITKGIYNAIKHLGKPSTSNQITRTTPVSPAPATSKAPHIDQPSQPPSTRSAVPTESAELSAALHPRYKINKTEFLKQYSHVMRATLDEGQAFALNKLVDAINKDTSIIDVRWAAYMLATIKCEVGSSFRPIEERGAPGSFKRYEFNQALGNTQKGDGYRYRGRGYIQITGRSNYRRMTELLRLSDDDDLEKYPENVLKPEISYMMLSISMQEGLFTGHKLRDYLHDSTTDYRGARILITGGLHQADVVAEQARLFEVALRWGREESPIG
jgi:predicted chitinase